MAGRKNESCPESCRFWRFDYDRILWASVEGSCDVFEKFPLEIGWRVVWLDDGVDVLENHESSPAPAIYQTHQISTTVSFDG